LAGAGLLGATGLLAACGSGGANPADVANASGALSFGSNQSDPVPKQAYAGDGRRVQQPRHPDQHEHDRAGPAGSW